MGDDDQPFRFLDLPPELRVRIYECFFEPNSQHDFSTRINMLDIETIKRQAPDLAILGTSHLVRREAYDIGKEAERHFFHETCFFLDLKTPLIYGGPQKPYTHDLRRMVKAISSLPRFPLSKIEFLLTHKLNGHEFWIRLIVSAASDGKLKGSTEFGEGQTVGIDSVSVESKNELFQTMAGQFFVGMKMTRRGEPLCLDMANLVEMVLFSMGWVTTERYRRYVY
ncbi:hypothetical protein LTR56_017720 [Elasticomyces elasticus]|nr:hypothetical protein LTR56_017720 [Elasticomyces elasticus]KAK3637744.1 hypothetical protein LTR22_018145 [Elasticomyces elasticus]KAK4915358.1 hypothetical protein LTR49_016489 [Elasticomyces elasticus]KAK5752276.1 hypothetical protein LTS12_017670 [Elasticomyces elasticus]